MNHLLNKFTAGYLVLILGFSFVAPAQAAVDTQPVIIAYGASIAELAKKVISEYEAQTHQKAERMRDGGMASDSILLAVDAGKADLGISGNSWDNMTALIKEKKIEVKNMDKIQSKVLGQDSVLFITYKGGPKELTQEQLKKLWSGEVKSWKEIGGDDVAVQLVIPNNTPSTQKTISQSILGGADIFRKGIKIINGGDETAKYVAATKGAIGFGGPMTNFGEANRPQHSPLSKPVTAITLGAPSANAAKIMSAMAKVLAGK
jgi:phosphate transport system substrate-binding protein